MNNKEFIQRLAESCGRSSAETARMVNNIIDAMGDSFGRGDSLTVNGFGAFEVKKKLERVITNPATGQRMLVPPKLVVGFRPSNVLKAILKKGDA